MENLLLLSIAPTLGVMSLGFFLGLKHATEADHLAAVSTIVTRRESLLSAALVGGLWGVGHTISLIAAGIFVLLLDFHISENTERMLESCVGLMLVVLGLNVLRKIIAGDTLHFHSHEHGSHTHVHPHIHFREENRTDHSHFRHGLSPRALIIGMIHGLAGSAALMLLVIPTIGSKLAGLAYILIFGIGSIGGMMLMSFFVGLPFIFTASRSRSFNVALQAVAGAVSMGLGVMIVYEKGFTSGLSG